MYFPRKHYLDHIAPLLPSSNALVLIGARQVGKTTLIEMLVGEGMIGGVLMLSGDTLQFEELGSPEQFYQYLRVRYGLDTYQTLIIDEAQRIEHIGIYIKYLVDLRKAGKIHQKIIISGSGSMEIFRGITDSLIGRYDLVRVYPFSFLEYLEYRGIVTDLIDSSVTLPVSIGDEISRLGDEYMRYGGYPAVVTAETIGEKGRILTELYRDYLSKDVALFLSEKEFFGFDRFLRLFASKIGSLIQVSAIADELHIPRAQTERYIELLEATFLFSRIPPYIGGKITHEIRKAHKGYFHDLGFLGMLLGIPSLDIFRGKMIENWVYTELERSIAPTQEIRFWQNTNGSEVDFLLIDPIIKKITPIEVKSGKKDILPKSLLSFVSQYGESIDRCYVTTDGYTGERNRDGRAYLFVDYRLIGMRK